MPRKPLSYEPDVIFQALRAACRALVEYPGPPPDYILQPKYKAQLDKRADRFAAQFLWREQQRRAGEVEDA